MVIHAGWVERPEGFLIGDVTGDGRVTSAGASLIAGWLIDPTLEICLLAADINGDGDVTIEDIVLLARWMVGHNVNHLIAH
jgi:hypothetical protein